MLILIDEYKRSFFGKADNLKGKKGGAYFA